MSYISLDFDSYESKIGYKFNNCQLLKTALTHSSCANTHLESNERLEFLGDATLGMVVANLLYCRFPQKTEGELSKLKGFIVSRHACKRVALQLGLDRYLRIGKGVNPIPDSLVSNVMEAVIGAIFIDGGFEAARSFVEDHFSEEIDAALNSGRIESKPSSKESDKSDEVFEDFKSLLQIETQRMFPGQKPIYIQLSQSGPEHQKSFLVATEVNGKRYSSAWGKSKKEAEQRAAGNALRQIKGQTPLFQ
jgi:ribonuclease-3